MAEPGLTAAYLRELRYSLGRLADADDVVAEVEDHLAEAVARLSAAGRSPAEVEAEALARFGSAELVARVFVVEARKGAAVSTTLTRRAGLAALAAPVLAVVGQAGNVTIDRGAAHGLAVALLVAALGACFFGLWGLRARHGGLGRLGRVAFWLTVASPAIAAPFSWGAGVALLFVLGAVMVLVSVAMLRAGVLPPVPVAFLAVAPLASMAIAATLTAAGRDAAPYIPLPLPLLVVGFVWLGWHLWREPALDAGRPRGGPFATA